MTCREFKHTAASLTLWELWRPHDEQMLNHADECTKCGAWLDKQQLLAASMQTLQARTASRQAGPDVERALLRMFRQVPFEGAQPVAAYRSAPIAFRLSRFFELGAYAAAAAAIVVGLFLGVRLLEHRGGTAAVRGQSKSARALPTERPAVAENAKLKEIAPTMHQQPAMSAKSQSAVHPGSRSVKVREDISVPALQTNDQDYVALMFCDPLSCSSEAQVVRMELPATGAMSDRDAQPQIADVVVGYDGVVRAVRIVN
jgi:hypothetical protein